MHYKSLKLTFSSVVLVFIAIIGGTAALTALSGCANRSARAPRAIRLLAGLDDSGSWEAHLPNNIALLMQACRGLTPGRDYLTVYRTDFRNVEVYAQAMPRSKEDLQATLVRALASPPPPKTRPELFWAEAARRIGQSTGPAVIVYGSDGDADGPLTATDDSLHHAGDKLASDSDVRAVVLFGISPQNRAAWRGRFSALDASGRLYLMDDSPETATRIADLLEECHRS